MSLLTVNGLRAISARFVFPWRGIWFADLIVDPDIAATMLTQGPAVIVAGAGLPPATLLGAIDPLATGTFQSQGRMRVLGGFGGWEKDVPAQDFQSPAGVLSTTVYAATAVLVGEKVLDVLPAVFPPHYGRAQGRASRVLEDADSWWVDPLTGITTVGPRPPAIPDPSLQVLSWDPLTKTAELVCDTLVQPGTPLIDLRIGESPVTIRRVEQTFDGGGSRVTAWCSTQPVDRLGAGLKSMIRELAGVGYLAVRRYRFVLPAGTNKGALQAVDRQLGLASPMPDLLPTDEWAGMSGLSAVLKPGTEVLVVFEDANPRLPKIVGYSTSTVPLELTMDATVATHVGPSSVLVDLAGGVTPLVLEPWAAGLETALATFAGALHTAIDPGVVTAGDALVNALGALPPPATLKVTAA